MKIQTIPCSFDNYSYLLICEETGQAAVIDPSEAYPVIQEIEKNNITLQAILCTHHHHDHVGDIGELLGEYGEVDVYCHQSDRDRIPTANTYVEDGASLRIGKLEGRVIYTPGHTSGSVCYNFQDALFTGDTLFGAGCGRLFEGTPEQMLNSLNAITAQYDDQTRVYFGHEYTRKNLEFALAVEPTNEDLKNRLKILNGEHGFSTPSRIDLEKKTNPFLRAAEESIKKGLELRGLQGLQSGLQVFTELRKLRNSF